MARRRARGKRLTRKAAKFIALERVSRMATSSLEGQPHLIPVCHVLVGRKIYIGSGTGRKVKNLRKNPRITVTVDIYSDDWSSLKGVMVQGRAKIIERGPAFHRAKKKLYAKYPQYARDAALSPSDSVILEIVPRHVYMWGID